MRWGCNQILHHPFATQPSPWVGLKERECPSVPSTVDFITRASLQCLKAFLVLNRSPLPIQTASVWKCAHQSCLSSYQALPRQLKGRQEGIGKGQPLSVLCKYNCTGSLYRDAMLPSNFGICGRIQYIFYLCYSIGADVFIAFYSFLKNVYFYFFKF